MIDDKKAETDNSWRYFLAESTKQTRDELNEHKKQYNEDMKRVFDKIDKMREDIMKEVKEGNKKTDDLKDTVNEIKEEVKDICNAHNIENIEQDGQFQAQIQKLQNSIEQIMKTSASEAGKKAGSDAGRETAETISKKYSQVILGICAAMLVVFEGLKKMGIL
jgi:ElaB/YqjD/DUF883 family membrane-anchored ribosome-binding protein